MALAGGAFGAAWALVIGETVITAILAVIRLRTPATQPVTAEEVAAHEL